MSVNLLFSINRTCIPMLLDCAASIARSGGAARYDLYILHSDLDAAAQETIRQGLPLQMSCRFVPVPEEMFEGFPTTKRYPKQIYYRLAAPLLLPKELDRILYLDVDIVVINPLTTLYQSEFGGACYLACTHTGRVLTKLNHLRLGVEGDVPYVNTGVLLMDLDALRGTLDLSALRRYAQEHRESMFLPDQDILTALYGDRVGLLDSMVYNLCDRTLVRHNGDPKNDLVDLDWIRKNTVIIHYCGRQKPHYGSDRSELAVFYRELKEQ